MSFAECLRHSLTRSISRQVTIGDLSNQVLVEIFKCYHDTARSWPKLLHICRRWRRILFEQLRLIFTHGAPVQKTLDSWPALSIVVEYGKSPSFDPPAPKDEDNIIAALKQSDRVSSVCLTVTNSLLEKLSAIKRPFPKLEHLVLLSQDTTQLTLPSAFGLGTQLRILRLTRITFFALPNLLYSSRTLVELHLHEVLNPWLFSPEALTDALSGMAKLRSLSLHFLPTPHHIGASLVPSKRIVLLALTRLSFRGTAKYFEDLVVGINAPRLEDIEVTLFDVFELTLSKLRKFVNRIESHKSYRLADITSSESAISISMSRPGTPTCLTLELLCEPIQRQLDNMAHICREFSTFLFSVVDLRIIVTRPSEQADLRIIVTRPRSGWANRYSEQWQRIILHFRSTNRLYVLGTENYWNICIMHALQPSERCEAVLPALHQLRIREPGPRYAPLRQAAVSLMASYRLSGRLIVEYERRWTNKLGGTGSP